MTKILLGMLMGIIAATAMAQTPAYQLPTTRELVGYQCPTAVQYVVTGNDGTTQTGLVFAECSQGARGIIWHNAACASASWDESGNLLSYEVIKTSNSRSVVPSSWCFGG